MKLILTEQQFKKVIAELTAQNVKKEFGRDTNFTSLRKAGKNLNEEETTQTSAQYLGNKVKNFFGDIIGSMLNTGQSADASNGSSFTGSGLDNLTITKNVGEAAQQAGVSPEALQQICVWETGKGFGYQMSGKDLTGYDLGDAGGKRTYGYGLLYHPNGQPMMNIKTTWTQPELEQLFIQTVKKDRALVDNWCSQHGVRLSQPQIDAMVSAIYNFGPGFLQKNICSYIAKYPNNPEIPRMWKNLSNGQGARFPGLLRRRAGEAEWYEKGIAMNQPSY